jgi:hypothetical protein
MGVSFPLKTFSMEECLFTESNAGGALKFWQFRDNGHFCGEPSVWRDEARPYFTLRRLQ